MSKYSESKHWDYSIFDNMTTKALEDILRVDSQSSNNDNFNIGAILYIMEVIAKREKEHPSGKFTDVHSAWASFCENYLPYIDGNDYEYKT